jgi:HPt (histidine-containing phosphotransfer) domain-containing protein
MSSAAAAILDRVEDSGTAFFPDAPAYDAVEFAALSEMIGEDGVLEMVDIFESETRQRLRRLAAGGQDVGTQRREMHTLRGAASTVAAPRLTALARRFECATGRGVPTTANDIEALAWALEAYLTMVQMRNGFLQPAAGERRAIESDR